MRWRRWLAVRGRLDGHRRRPVAAEPEPAEAPPPTGKRARGLITGLALAGVTAAAAMIMASGHDTATATTLACVPGDCRATGPTLTVTGRLTGAAATRHRPYLLIRVQSTQRWYLGPAIVGDGHGAWSQQVGLGNPVPQPKDRQFVVCVYLLPPADVDRVVRTQIDNRPDGLADVDLPPQRVELACTPATRPADT